MTAPTARQLAIVEWMRAYQLEHAMPPTLREIGAHFGIRSTNGVSDHLVALEKKGLVRSRPVSSRGWMAIDSTPAASNLGRLHEDLCGDLERIARRFKREAGAKLTLVVRMENVEGDPHIVIGDDDLDHAIETIRVRQAGSAHTFGPDEPTRQQTTATKGYR